MLTGGVAGLEEYDGTSELLKDPPPELDDDDDIELSKTILYRADFEDLKENHVQYDTIIWVLISLLLVLAWGVGILMLLYLPVRRYVLKKEIDSRKLYVTPSEIIYKVRRPLFLPFFGVTRIEKHVPLVLVIDIIIEQGCLQSVYGIHTFRVESIAHGKASPVDELLVQGVSNPKVLKKVIMTEASKLIQEIGRGWKPTVSAFDGEITFARMASTSAGSTVRSPHKISKNSFKETGGPLLGDLVLQKLEEVEQSVKKLESFVMKPQAFPKSS